MKHFSDGQTWSFEAVPGDPDNHPFPTCENIRGANPDPWVVEVFRGPEPYARVYTAGGERDRCEHVAKKLAQSGAVSVRDWRDELATMWWAESLFLGAP